MARPWPRRAGQSARAAADDFRANAVIGGGSAYAPNAATAIDAAASGRSGTAIGPIAAARADAGLASRLEWAALPSRTGAADRGSASRGRERIRTAGDGDRIRTGGPKRARSAASG